MLYMGIVQANSMINSGTSQDSAASWMMVLAPVGFHVDVVEGMSRPVFQFH